VRAKHGLCIVARGAVARGGVVVDKVGLPLHALLGVVDFLGHEPVERGAHLCGGVGRVNPQSRWRLREGEWSRRKRSAEY
jgi:hypothetical protein